jgi:hypothetical protein
MKAMVPEVGAPVAGAVVVIVAVNVTASPKTAAALLEVITVVALAFATAWLIALEVLVAEVVSPLKSPVIESVGPTGSTLVVQVATPVVTGRAVQPAIAVPARLKATAPPAGIAVAGATGAIVAVKVTGSVRVVVASPDVTTVVVLCFATACVVAAEVLVR